MSKHNDHHGAVDRRKFLVRAAGMLGGAAFLGASGLACKKESSGGDGTPASGGGSAAVAQTPFDLVIAKNATATALVTAAFDAMGGIGAFVRAGQKVCLKPNAAWARETGSGACTNPEIIDALVGLILGVGVQPNDIAIFEHTRDPFVTAMAWNGIQEVCDKHGVSMVDGSSQANYQAVDPVEGTKYLMPFDEKEEVAYDLLRADVVINLPVLKGHSATELSMGMKNLMGVIYNPRRYHGSKDADAGGEELDERIVDLTMLLRRNITLTLLDATYVLRVAGPKGVEGEPGDELKTIILGTDPLAVDSAGAQVYGMAPDEVGHVKAAAARGIGEMDLDKLRSSDRLHEIDLGEGASSSGDSESVGSGDGPVEPTDDETTE